MLVTRFVIAPPPQAADTGHPAPLPGMPPRDSISIYSAIGVGMLDSVARHALSLVYVPLGGEASVAGIDPHTFPRPREVRTGSPPPHLRPSYDLRTPLGRN